MTEPSNALPSTSVRLTWDRIIQLATPIVLNAEPDLGLYDRTQFKLSADADGVTIDAAALVTPRCSICGAPEGGKHDLARHAAFDAMRRADHATDGFTPARKIQRATQAGARRADKKGNGQ